MNLWVNLDYASQCTKKNDWTDYPYEVKNSVGFKEHRVISIWSLIMRHYFGNKDTFALEYENAGGGEHFFEIWVDKKAICCFYKNGSLQRFKWNLNSIVEWFEANMSIIMTEEEFPLPVEANSSIEFYNKSSEYDSDEMEEFNRWFDIRQEWCFHHSWFINRDGAFLADVYFRTVKDKIEIEWDNVNEYEGIIFQNPKGIFYVDKQAFCDTINCFISSYRGECIN
jgi:hypothetical protein